MDRKEKKEIEIQKFLDGDLDADARLKFENQLNIDPLLQEELKNHKLLLAGIRYQARKKNWDKIQQLEEDSKNQPSIKLIKNKHWLYAAASISLLLVAVAMYYILNSGGERMQDLYAENFSAYPALTHAPVRGEEIPKSIIEQAYAAYTNEQYSEAIDLFQTILKEKEDPLMIFYLGNAFLASERYGEAIASFEQVLEEETILKDQSKWYLGLSYLAKGNKEAALILFRELASGSSTYSNKAQLIINQL